MEFQKFGIREMFSFWKPESRVLESGIQLKITDPTNEWNPESQFRGQRLRYPLPGIRNL